MKPLGWPRLVAALAACVVLAVSLPSIAGAQQASGGNAPVGVQAPAQGNQPAPAVVQLPRTGNPEADSGLPTGLIVAGLAVAMIAFRGRWLVETFGRRRR